MASVLTLESANTSPIQMLACIKPPSILLSTIVAQGIFVYIKALMVTTLIGNSCVTLALLAMLKSKIDQGHKVAT